jgi:glycosyltransferase involved in cell wall biosynthesis
MFTNTRVETAEQRPTRPLRVLMVVRLFLPWIGGTERQALGIAKELTKEGIRVQVLTGRWIKGTARRETIEGVDVFRNHTLWEFFGIRGARKLGGYLYIITLIWQLWRRRRSYDIIHVHALNYHTFAAVLAGRRLGRPVVTKLANSGPASDIEKMKVGQQLALSHLMLPTALRSDRFVAVNRAVVRELAAVGVPTTRIARIPNGVEISRSNADRTYRLHDPVRLIFVGRLHEQKGVDVLLRSFRDLRALRSEQRLCLRLVGDGPLRATLLAIAKEMDVSPDVEFVGARSDVAELLDGSDVFVLPSRAEGLSNALLEAMAIGLPVVASRVPGNEDVVTHDQDGLLFSANDAASLTSELMRVLDDVRLREAIGRRARVTVEEKYGMACVARQYIELYEELMLDGDAGVSMAGRKPA